MEKLNDISIGERVRTIRENISMNKEKFSEMIDVSETLLEQIENGEASLDINTLESISTCTGYSTDFILFGTPSDNSNIKRIERMLNRSSDKTVDLIYTVVHDIYSYNRKSTKKKHK